MIIINFGLLGIVVVYLILIFPLQFGVVYSTGVVIIIVRVVLAIIWLNQTNRKIGDFESLSVDEISLCILPKRLC